MISRMVGISCYFEHPGVSLNEAVERYLERGWFMIDVGTQYAVRVDHGAATRVIDSLGAVVMSFGQAA